MKFLPQLFITRQKTADKFVLKQMTHPVSAKVNTKSTIESNLKEPMKMEIYVGAISIILQSTLHHGHDFKHFAVPVTKVRCCLTFQNDNS